MLLFTYVMLPTLHRMQTIHAGSVAVAPSWGNPCNRQHAARRMHGPASHGFPNAVLCWAPVLNSLAFCQISKPVSKPSGSRYVRRRRCQPCAFPAYRNHTLSPPAGPLIKAAAMWHMAECSVTHENVWKQTSSNAGKGFTETASDRARHQQALHFQTPSRLHAAAT